MGQCVVFSSLLFSSSLSPLFSSGPLYKFRRGNQVDGLPRPFKFGVRAGLVEMSDFNDLFVPFDLEN